VTQLTRPLSGSPPVTQGIGPTTFTGEPAGYWYPDQSIDYYTQGDGTLMPHLHCGIDYGVPCGTPVLAAADGTVTFAGWDTTGFGNCVKVNHGDVTTLYGHLSDFPVHVGERVTRGVTIGLSGTTGNSTGCHLHWSVIRDSDGHYVSPVPYMTPAPVLPPAPPDGINHVPPFSVVTAADVSQWDGPSDRLHQMGHCGPGTAFTCDAWMHGEPATDVVTGQVDRRWYHIQTGGWVKSARVRGNAPGSTP